MLSCFCRSTVMVETSVRFPEVCTSRSFFGIGVYRIFRKNFNISALKVPEFLHLELSELTKISELSSIRTFQNEVFATGTEVSTFTVTRIDIFIMILLFLDNKYQMTFR